MKLLKTQWSDSDEVARRMRDEARLLGLLRHRNIVDVLDLTRIDGRAAVVMEYLEGIDLKKLNEELRREGQSLPVRPALEVAAAVAGALDAAYNRPPMPGEKPLRVIHRDIKPSNVMVDESARVKVLDFGVARSELEDRESHTQELQYGSVDYMAPERLFFEPETPSSDVYSLGASLFELLTGEKLGKARGRPSRHAEHLASRFGLLPDVADTGPEAASALRALLQETLAFGFEERPTAAEFYQRARTLARLVPGDDLGVWCEQVLPPLVPRVLDARRSPNPLDDTVLLEDSKAFSSEPDPSPAPVATGAALRRGALAELEASGDPAVDSRFAETSAETVSTRGGAPVEPDPEEAWEDGPTQLAVAREAPDLAAVLDGLDAPLNTEEAVRRTARGAAARELPPDPADPFAVLTEASGARAARPAGGGVRDGPVPLPMAPTPSVRGRMPTMSALDTVPDLDLDAALAPPVDTGRAAGLPPALGTPEHEPPPEEATEVLAMPPSPGSMPDAGPPFVETPAVPQAEPAIRGAAPAQGLDEATESGSVGVVAQGSVTQSAPEATHASPVLVGLVVEEDEEDVWPPEAERSGGLRRPLLRYAALAVVIGGFAGGAHRWFTANGVADAVPPVGAPPAVLASPGSAEAPGAAAPAGPALVFRSSLDNLRKLRVQCDIGSAKGVTEAVVAGEAARRCTVTAILNDRSRQTTVLEAPEAGVYECFGDERGCKGL